jgi:hypothetical protein
LYSDTVSSTISALNNIAISQTYDITFNVSDIPSNNAFAAYKTALSTARTSVNTVLSQETWSNLNTALSDIQVAIEKFSLFRVSLTNADGIVLSEYKCSDVYQALINLRDALTKQQIANSAGNVFTL